MASIPTSATGRRDEDPTGVLHPLHYTYRMGDKWVNVTTVPMLYAAYPLYLVGGDRAVLLLPMLGAVLCALAARALARRLGGGDGWTRVLDRRPRLAGRDLRARLLGAHPRPRR